MKKKINKNLFYVVLLFMCVLPFLALAQDPPPYQLLADGLPYVGAVPADDGLAGYLEAFFKLGLGIAVTLAVLLFVYNGVVYMTSDATGQKAAAVGAFKDIVTGLLIVFAAVMVLSQINPQLTNFGLFTSLNTAKYCIEHPGEKPTCTSADAVPPPGPTTPPDGKFEYDNSEAGGNIALQRVHASAELERVLSCMERTVPGNVGRISSISDNKIVMGEKTFQQCAAEGNTGEGTCAHRIKSQHYGGSSAICIAKNNSYAVDFGDDENKGALRQAAVACGGNGVGIADEGSHLHVSVGTLAGCPGGI